MVKLSIIVGTRPEIIKLSPLIRITKKQNTDIIFTSQHYDYEMGLKFFDELHLRKPDHKLKLSSNNPAIQIGEIIQKLSKILTRTKPETVVVEGDTNTVLAGALASLKSKIPISHVEAGLRSFDWRMPEEHNRIATDHISELLFAPTLTSKKNLVNERVHGNIFVTGNTVMDALEYNIKIAKKETLTKLDKENYILTTIHRAENVDNKKTLGEILKALLQCNEKIIFPIHPRTKKRMQQFGYYNKIKTAKHILLLRPVGYFEMLMMMKKSKFIMTDSGGIQEEATSPHIKKKTLVVRISTDRPEAVKAEMSELVETSSEKILKSIKRFSNNPSFPSKKSPFGQGDSAKKILKILQKSF